MVKKIIGFNDILNKQVEFIQEYKGFKFYTIQGKKECYDNAFVEIDNNFIISICRVDSIENESIIEPIQGITENLISEYKNSLENNKLVNGAIREYLFQTNRITIEENEKALSHNILILETKEKEREQKEIIKANKLKEKEEQRQIELLEIERRFKNSEKIKSNDFIDLCNKYNINIPIKVIGWINSKASEIGIDAYKASSKSTTIFKYAEILNQAII